MSGQGTVIAVFRLHEDVEAAVKTLREAGFGTEDFSVAGRNFHTLDSPVGYHKMGDQIEPCGTLGPFWHGLLAPSSEFVLLWVPDLGPLVVAGKFVSRVMEASKTGSPVYGLTLFGMALKHLELSNDTILACEDAIEHDHFILIVQCAEKDLGYARDALAASEAEWMEIAGSSLQTTS